MDVAVIAVIVYIRWQAQYRAVPDPGIPGAAELPMWWWKVGWIGDWFLYPGADAGLWAMNIEQWLAGGPLDLHRPPLFTVLTGLATPLFGDLVFAGHMVNHVLALLVCVLIYAFGRATSGRGAALGAAMLTTLSMDLLNSQMGFGVDTTLQFVLMLLALASWYAAGGRWWRLIPAGIAGGLAAGGHFIAFAFVVPAALLLLLTDRKGPGWLRNVLAPPLVLTLSYVVWKVLMIGYPTASLPRILTMYGEAVHSYNPGATPDGGVTVMHAVTLFLGHLWEAPTEPITRALQPFASFISIPWWLLLPLCVLGLLGPGLRTWRAPRIRWSRRPAPKPWSTTDDGWVWNPGLILRITRKTGWDWRPCLWLLLFLGPLVIAAAANAPERYTHYCLPFLFLTALRGIASLAAAYDHLASSRVASWPNGALAFVICLALSAWVWSNSNVQGMHDPFIDEGILQRVVGADIKQEFGDEGCVVTLTPEYCYFGGGLACPSNICPKPGDNGLRICFKKFMDQTPNCRGDLAFVMEPAKDHGPFLDPSDEMDVLVAERFDVEEAFRLGESIAVVYRLDRNVMKAIVAGAPVWPEPRGDGQ